VAAEYGSGEYGVGDYGGLIKLNVSTTADATASGIRIRLADIEAGASVSGTDEVSRSRKASTTANASVSGSRSALKKDREADVTSDGSLDGDLQFLNVFASEQTRSLTWEYDADRRAYISEWVEKYAEPRHDLISLYMTGEFGQGAKPTIQVEYDRDGDGKKETQSTPKPIPTSDKPVVFDTLNGDSGYYRLVLRNLRPGDIIASIEFGPSHD
jgi:hypothetical protein